MTDERPRQNEEASAAKAKIAIARPQPGALAALNAFSRWAGIFTVAVGSLALASWIFNLSALTSIVSGFATMKVNTALSFMLAGSAHLTLRGAPARRWRRAAQVAAIVVAVCGLLTLGEYVFNWNLGLDQWLMPDPDPTTLHPGRMSPITAFNFVMIGVTLVSLARARHPRVAQVLALTTAFLSLLGLIGYLYGAEQLYRIGAFIGVALPTAMTFFILSLGLLVARLEAGPVAILGSPSAGGVLVRSLLPTIVILPILIGWLGLRGQAAGLFDVALGAALRAVANVIVISLVIGWVAASLRRVDAEREAAINNLSAAYDGLEAQVDRRTADLAATVKQLETEISERVRAQAALDVQNQYLNSLHEITLDMISNLNRDSLLQSIVEQAAVLAECRDVYVALHDASADQMVLKFGVGRAGEHLGLTYALGEGLVGQAWKRGEAVIIEDYNRSPIRKQAFDWVSSAMGIPLRSGGDVVGVIGLIYGEPDRRFDAAQLAMMERLARLAELALQNARLYEAAQTEIARRAQFEDQMRKQNQYLESLHEVTLGLLNQLDPSSVLESILSRAAALINTEHGFIDTLEEAKNILTQSLGIGDYARMIGFETQRGMGVTGTVWKTGETLVVNDYPTWASHYDEFAWTKTVVGVPLKIDGEVVGVLGVSYQEEGRTFSPEDIAILERFGQLASLTLRNARLYDSAQQEIAERRAAQEALRASEERFRRLIESAPDGVALSNQRGQIVLANTQLHRLFGYAPDELVGMKIERLMPRRLARPHPELRAAFFAEGGSRQMGADRRILARHKNGHEFTVEVGLSVIELDSGSMAVSFVRDISERREQEEALRLSEERFRLISSVSSDYTFSTEIGPQGELVDSVLGGAFESITGYTPEEFTALGGWRASLHPDDVERDEHDLEMLGKNQPIESEIRIIKKGGEARWVRVTAHPVWDAKRGKLAGIHGAVQDITERKRAEQALQAERDFAQQIMNAMGQGLIVADSEGETLFVNAAAARMLGGEPEKFIGASVYDPVFGVDHNILNAAWERRQQGAADSYETMRTTQDGQQMFVLISAVPYRRDGKVIGSISTVTDLTERKRAEDDLRESRAQYQALAAEAQAQAKELALLHQVRTAISAERDLPALFRAVVESIVETLGYSQVSLYRRVGETLIMEHQIGYKQVIREIPVSKGVAGRVALSGKPVLIEDVATDPDFLAAIPNLGSEICVPLIDRDRVFGVLNIESFKGERLAQADLSLMLALSEHISLAIQHARLLSELQAERDFARQVMDILGSGLTIIDREARFVFVNQAYARMLGYEPDELIGKTPYDTTVERDHYRVRQSVKERLSGEESTHEVTLRRKDGREVYVLIKAVPRTKDGEVMGGIATVTDLTERHRAEQELQAERDFARLVMDTMGQGLIITDLNERMEYVNPAMAHMLGHEPPDMIGQIGYDFVAPEALETIKERVHLRQEGVTDSYELNDLHADGHRVPVLITGVPLRREGKVVGSVGVVTDLTEQKKVEQALAQARDEALEASRLKSEFLANMSHEIRTPLSGALGLLELALDTPLTPEQRDYLSTARLSANNLLSLINDILDLSKIEAGRLELEETPFDLRTVVEQALAAVRPRVANRNLRLTSKLGADVPAGLVGDPLRLRQTLLNLLGNAIKFTSRGSVSLSVKLKKQAANMAELQFSIRDTGIGIPADKQGVIFEAFSQADGSTTRKYGGTGLGLTITERLVKKMGGKVWVKSAPGKGSAFHFTARFSLADSSLAASLAGQDKVAGPDSDFRPARIHALLAEDNAINQRVIVRMLQKQGWQVTPVDNGKKVVTRALKGGFDVVLMDLQMPGVDGFAATAAIRAAERESGQHIPIIALTAHAMQGDRERCLAAGMDEYLAKPVTAADLIAMISRAASGRGQPQGQHRQPETARLAVFDRAEALMYCADDVNTLHEIIATFEEGWQAELDALRTGLAARDSDALHTRGHRLKGQAKVLAAGEVAAIAQSIEDCSRGDDFDGAAALIEQLPAALKRLHRALSKELKS